MNQYDAWPTLDYEAFKPTQHILHMLSQIIGKLKLTTPFEPHWANVALWLTAEGLTTGPIPYEKGVFEVRVDLSNHKLVFISSWGKSSTINLKSTSISALNKKIFEMLQLIDVNLIINPTPQEIPHPIPFHEDTVDRQYSPQLANSWWRIIVSSYRVMLKYHSKFKGASPQIGLMWGTFDLRDARYINQSVPTEGMNAGYIRRNAMDMAQVEVGFWSGNEQYPKPAYYSFLYPGAQTFAKIKLPSQGNWNDSLQEFVLDYELVRNAKSPEADLLAFFESSYRLQTEQQGWDKMLIGTGEPV